MLPDYISKTTPNPSDKRAPWYSNTAPTYAGIFLWVVFYMKLAENTLDRAGLGLCLLALVIAGVLCYKLYYYVPAMLGMKTGYPLYVVGSSTFGTTGGYLMPGLLMGLLQIGWFSVGTFVATNFMLAGVGSDAKPGSMTYAIVAIVWGYMMGYVGIKGIQYVSKVALFLNFIPAVMLIIVLFKTLGGVSAYVPDPAKSDPWGGMSLIIAAVVGFFATAGAAGADFGMNNRHEGDVKKGGIVGIALAAIFAGGLPIIAIAGAHGLDPSLTSYNFQDIIAKMGGFLSPAMFFLFTLASVPAACVCALILGNSFATMLPGVPRMGSTMVGVTIAIVLAVTGTAANLIGFFSIVGASFGPICGAMVADYLLAGKKWAGPRQGINWAGYSAWAIGFVVGILPFLPLPEKVKAYSQPAVVYSFIVGFLVYFLLAKAGLEPSVVPVETAKPLGARSAKA